MDLRRPTQIIIVAIGILIALALIDILTSWALFPLPAIGGCLAGALVISVYRRRTLPLVIALLLAACFAFHIGYGLWMDHEAGRWATLEIDKADRALSRALGKFDLKFTGVRDAAGDLAEDSALRASLEGDDTRGTFEILSQAHSSKPWKRDEWGILVTDESGASVAWVGELPDVETEGASRGTRPVLRLTRSTTHYWIEGSASMDAGSGCLGTVKVFRQLEAIYPGILPGPAATTNSEYLSASLGHDMRVVLTPDASASDEPAGDREMSREIRLPDGTPVGRIVVKVGTVDDRRDMLTRQGLFLSGVALLLLVIIGSIAVLARLLGAKLHMASRLNLALALLILGGMRLVLSALRQPLNLGALEAFSPYRYATQMPLGLLRSPADLVLTVMVLIVGASLVLMARHRRASPSQSNGPALGDSIPHLVMGILVGVLASGVVLSGDFALRRLLTDSVFPFLSLSPFAFSWADALLRVGLFGAALALMLTASALITWQISLLERFWPPTQGTTRGVALSAAVLFAVLFAFVSTGTALSVLVTGMLCMVTSVLIELVRRRRISVGLIVLATAFAIGASILEFPYALRDLRQKQREAIEARAVSIMSRTDAWKVSVLAEALEWVAGNRQIEAALAGGEENLDDLALGIWAGSMLSRARIISGVHILNAGHEEIGRFSLEEVVDLRDIEGAFRGARFSPIPITMVTRGSFGARDVELYVGIAPFFKDDTYVGSVVVSIPYFYRDLESIAGVEPALFETIGGNATSGTPWQPDYSASLISDNRIVSTTSIRFEVGKTIHELDGLSSTEPGWLVHDVAGLRYASYLVPFGGVAEALLLSFVLPTLGGAIISFTGILVGNLIIGFLIIAAGGIARGVQHIVKRSRGLARARLRWGFAGKLALAFVLIAIVPTLILGTASRTFLRARFREIMESKAAESLSLTRLALERLVAGEAIRLARNPILIDELIEEPSILGMLVSHDVASAVFDARGGMLAGFGRPAVPSEVLDAVLEQGRSYTFFSVEDGLFVNSAVPVRDVVDPQIIRGCAFVSRKIDDALARRLATDLRTNLNFFGLATVAASSKPELFVSELMASRVSPDAYIDCYISGRELHFTWDRIGSTDVVVGYRALRAFDGTAVGAMSVPLVFRKDDVGRRLEGTTVAISYLLVIVMGLIFIFGLVLARRISRPIKDLIRGTMRIGSGDLEFTIPRSGDDEIGDLVTSFNKMTHALAKSRKALSERKRYIETIIGNVGAGIISTDWKGRVDTLNSAAEAMLGIKGRNARGRDAQSVLRRVGASDLADVLEEAGADRGLSRREATLTRKDGSVLTVRAVASAVRGPRGRPMGKVVVFEDVTELIRSKKLIAWSEMARQVAHEIKNPLTPMKLSAQHLLHSYKDRAGDFDQVIEDSVATIVEQIECLRRIAVEFSQFSRMPERKMENVDVNGVLKDSVAQYEGAVEPGVRMITNLDPELPAVRVDRDELRRLFLNIIENAIQAMPAGGTLRIVSGRGRGRSQRTAYDIHVSSGDRQVQRSGRFVEVGFQDDGSGISGENAGKLFEPNFSTKSSGTGLGLAICKGILDAHGGEMIIESTPGVGTMVRVKLPISEKYSSRPPRRRRPRRRHQK
jgi:PAS domain S-box-containing protein